ncbi:ABC transporter ATP-binding protein [Proteiniborus sp. MB09-C3]|uniref:ABC transporter ATP-binding protein n=1 Tax=Proteiniborus sp. MB09-C3 TaxID=3050072 RepID=UPI0025571083|nr:ABC transporter ATP-binding protein [Proteiniborus sp. MB09-C3]WIV10487.1 ABC transporter ATP-binding protein [Proteiniborus sp. MB09-C3]
MTNFHEEETLGKAYDSKLMKRLLSYAKPYWVYILICIVLLIAVTAGDLARPYILKYAIDDTIRGYLNPMYVLDKSSGMKGILYKDKIYVRENELSDSEKEVLKNSEMKTILKVNGNYYLVNGYIKSDNHDPAISEQNNEYVLTVDNDKYTADLLSTEDYRLFREKDIKNLKMVGIIFLAVIVLSFAFNYAQVFILNYTSQKIVFNIRQEIFSHLQKMSLSYFDKNPVGRLVTRVTNDTEALNEMYSSVLVTLFKDLFLLTGIIVTMFNMNAKLALFSFTVLPFIIIASIIFRINIRRVYRAVRVRLARINSSLNENITGMKTVHIFSKENKKLKEFDEINKDYLKAANEEIQLYAIFRPAIEIIRSLGLTLIIWIGGNNVINGAIEFGVLYAFINYLQMFFEPILDLTEKYNILQSAMASSERIFMIMDTEEDIKNSEQPIHLDTIKGKIEFKNVWFAYEKDNWVLRDVSFTINPGEAVAFVGATGAGKTSIISLINRFYDIQKGQILIDGIDIKDMDKYQLRRRIGIVLQDVFLFTGTIKDNIRLNNADISDKEIKEVAKYVNADTFIEKLPKKYEEPVMERGSTLSAGQRQLLAFARALAFKPDILVLDEATSNIDTETEILIQDALGKIVKGRTSIAIAHRLSTIQRSDKIIVLHKGQIREIGSHQELLNKGGMYYELYKLQYKEDFQLGESL